ncbi:MAG: thioredoxin family protein [Candidatus Aenigmatarchaeota archaeon]
MNIYAKAFVITVFVFLFGLFVGLNIERFMLSDLEKRSSSIEGSIRDIELEMLYFQGLNETDSCTFLKEIVRKTNNQLDVMADQLSSYGGKDILFTTDQVASAKATYTSLLIKGWILQERIKAGCNSTGVSVLYFYSTDNCDDCLLQGDVLMLLKDTFKDKLMVFPLDVDVDSNMIGVLMSKFGVKSTPSLVIDGQLYSGIVQKDKLKNIICSGIPGVPECA